MLRKLALALAALTFACAPVTPPQTPAPSALPTLTVTVVATVPPTVTITPGITPAPVPPTPEPPIGLLHPPRVGLSSINVLETWCYSTTTSIFVYDYGMQWVEDEAARVACVAKGTL